MVGVALGPCTVPAAGNPGFALGDDEMELGLGIHGEQGVRRTKIEPADVIVEYYLPGTEPTHECDGAAVQQIVRDSLAAAPLGRQPDPARAPARAKATTP